jgi:Protein of unknown function (DUF3311)
VRHKDRCQNRSLAGKRVQRGSSVSFSKWLALVPFALILGGVFFFNDVLPLVLGLPLLLAWLVFCVLLTSAVMAVVYACDPANRGPDGSARS